MVYGAHWLTDLDTHSELMLHHILKKAAQYTNVTSEENVCAVLQQCAQIFYLLSHSFSLTRLFCRQNQNNITFFTHVIVILSDDGQNIL